ncbi:MAG: cytochrome c biosis protein CcmG, thiol:disulfide interchange protein DsbE [Solirubrobacteraceae bacterium]|nr:cytochrome c biosis protein CcmG, thiol:disulfide interchange protein DsbE [Solirubrobacteraceae bacterium]
MDETAATADSPSPLRWVGRGIAILVAVSFVALLGYGLATKSNDTRIDDALADGRPAKAPGFDLDVLQRGDVPARSPVAAAAADGKIGLRELRGSPVVLNFWASWCVPCRQESPDLQREWTRARRDGVVVLGLDQQDVTDDARAFIREFKLTYPMVREGGNGTSRRYGTTGLPETFFISPAGQVVGHVIGVTSPDQLRLGVAAAKAGRPLGVEAGGDQRKGP